jgi:hypothetical protein
MMSTKQITLTVLEIDEIAGLINYQLSLSNGTTSTAISFYHDIDFFKKFAQDLINFPKTIDDSVLMEIGKDNLKWAYWIRIRIYCYEPAGRTAIEIKINNNEEVPQTNKCEFFINTVPASINNFGQMLMNWNPEVSNKISWIAE